MVVGTRKRRYYKPSSTGVAAPVSGYIVKWLGTESSSQVNNDGPYNDIEEAAQILQAYLKSGICSWMVSYDD
jgi:hypothetical protein